MKNCRRKEKVKICAKIKVAKKKGKDCRHSRKSRTRKEYKMEDR
jgi:hypothetical protein